MTNQHRKAPVVIPETNLSHAWARVLWRLTKKPGNELGPLIITIGDFDKIGGVQEDGSIRDALDRFLASTGDWSSDIVAFTIFPQRYLEISGHNRQEFYQLCSDALPHLKARNHGRDFYFSRLMNFGAAKHNDNQLEFIIGAYLEGARRTSMFQASIFDPVRDQTRQPYQTFPCLQSVSFVPTEEGLIVNGFYAMQYLVRRCYGNLLGLANLGSFMASEMKIPFTQLNMIAGVEKLDFPKSRLEDLLQIVAAKVPDLRGEVANAA